MRVGEADSMRLDLGCGEQKSGDVGVDIRRLKTVDVVADAHCLPFRSEVFSCCGAMAVLEHVDNPFTVLKEIYRVLKFNGVLHVLLPRRSRMPFYQAKLLVLLRWRKAFQVAKSLREGTHKWQFSIDGFAVLLEKAGFRVDEVFFLLDHHVPFSGNIVAEATKK